MSNAGDKLWVALHSREVNAVTRALSELAEKLAYQLKPPYTEVLQLKAKEEGNRYEIQFSARLHLHYMSLRSQDEGLVFTLEFSGEAYSDSPNLPVDDLFAPGLTDSLSVYGYGTRWPGQTMPTPDLLAKNVDVRSRTLNKIPLDDFLKRIGAS